MPREQHETGAAAGSTSSSVWQRGQTRERACGETARQGRHRGRLTDGQALWVTCSVRGGAGAPAASRPEQRVRVRDDGQHVHPTNISMLRRVFITMVPVVLAESAWGIGAGARQRYVAAATSDSSVVSSVPRHTRRRLAPPPAPRARHTAPNATSPAPAASACPLPARRPH